MFPASAVISSSIAIIALLLSAYFVLRKENRDDGLATTQRLLKIETELALQRVEQANQNIRQQGFQAEIEGVADYSARERVAMSESLRREHEVLKEHIKEQIKDVPTMRELLYRLVERMENMGKVTDKLDSKMDQIVVLLTHK